MKKIFAYGLIIIVSIFLVGCGNNTSTDKLVSTDDKLVFSDTNGYYMVFNYDGDNLKSVQWIMDYETEEAAETVYNMYTGGDYTSMYEVEIQGSVITLTYLEDYAANTYGVISKDVMETYMTNAGYTIVK